MSDQEEISAPWTWVSYEGPELWAVRWNERGFDPRITQFDENSESAKSFYNYVKEGYERQQRTPGPQLLKATVTWEVVE